MPGDASVALTKVGSSRAVSLAFLSLLAGHARAQLAGSVVTMRSLKAWPRS